MAATKVSLKLFIDKKRQRVLYAEADKDFVDFLFSIFTLPLGVVTRLLKEGGGMVGSWQSLYQSIENLSVTHINRDKSKFFLLEPKVFMPGAKVPLLLPNIGSTFLQLYSCTQHSSNVKFCSFVAIDDSAICPTCLCKMDQNVKVFDPLCEFMEFCTSAGGYVKWKATYMVMDDLEVKVLSTSSFFTLLKEFDVEGIGAIEEKVVDLGMDELLAV
ncbi:uncharacterized protein LOC133863392 [Alnus glutinosa]|uniref:uncharacterized protein LOC133863392 n=1 Tax=Alnus glutinosa TaxID=3517 RepID=UPI002D76AF50|nr:uncharacterized protein LOC133863392 [Alnus glutinosa]